MKINLLLILLLTSFSAIAAPAGPLPSQSPLPANAKVMSTIPEKDIKIGTWVEYKVIDIKNKKITNLKFAFVGREDAGRKTWVEITMRNGSKTTYIKMLYKGKPGDKMGEAEKIIVKFGNLQAMELPAMSKPETIVPMLHRKPIKKPVLVGKTDVRTPAGLFPKAAKVKGIDPDGNIIEVYHHPSVKMWGMLKFNDGRVDMELIGQGGNARSRITGKPAPFMMPR
ncbi:hypothetical protein KKF34_15530 [Myxococcota bacterium]|nr:hypothetical protein [Myxococcota bacterium]MBU1382736.1 hypothetical protein [Myxococcota bacterium]MBU1498286.1 hypothetical protein [Myxococcota bacterium]